MEHIFEKDLKADPKGREMISFYHWIAFYQINMSSALTDFVSFLWMNAVVENRNGCGKKNSSLTLKRPAMPTAYNAFNYFLLSQSNSNYQPSKPLGCQSAPVVLPLADNILATTWHNGTTVSTYMHRGKMCYINSIAKRALHSSQG